MYHITNKTGNIYWGFEYNDWEDCWELEVTPKKFATIFDTKEAAIEAILKVDGDLLEFNILEVDE